MLGIRNLDCNTDTAIRVRSLSFHLIAHKILIDFVQGGTYFCEYSLYFTSPSKVVADAYKKMETTLVYSFQLVVLSIFYQIKRAHYFVYLGQECIHSLHDKPKNHFNVKIGSV